MADALKDVLRLDPAVAAARKANQPKAPVTPTSPTTKSGAMEKELTSLQSDTKTKFQEMQTASAEEIRAKAEEDRKLKEGQAKIFADISGKAQEATTKAEGELKSYDAFHPSQETQTGLATMFALTNLAAFMSGGAGRYAGMAALGNMTNAMKGYQAGRKDVFDREMKEYDKNVASLKMNNEKVLGSLKRYMELLPKNKEAAMDALLAARAADNNGIVAAMIKSGNTKGAYDVALKASDALEKRLQKTQEMEQREQQHMQTIAAANERARLQREQTKALAEARLNAPGKTAKSNATQQQFENITSADIGNAYFRIDQYLKSSKNGEIPEGSKFLRDKGTQLGIVDAYKNYLINATLPPDLQQNDAALLGIAFDVVAARAFGRAAGVTDSKIAQVVRQLPVEGDSEETKQTKMRILLNQLEEPNKLLPEEKRKNGADYMRSPTSKSVYSVYSEQSDEAIGKKEGSTQMKSFKTSEEADKAAAKGEIKSGDKIVVGGQSGTYH